MKYPCPSPQSSRRFLHRACISVAAVVLLMLPAVISAQASGSVSRASAGRTPDGVDVEVFTLTSQSGAQARIMTYGAIVLELRIPDAKGAPQPVILEVTPSVEGFERGFPQSAAVFGRVANRIARARFVLDGREFQVTQNNGRNHIHGGRKNFSRVVWTPSLPARVADPAVTLTYRSADGEEGFPGNLTASVTYTLTHENVLRLEYRATTDQATPINLTNHAYFNLAGKGDVRSHVLTLNANEYTAVDAELIPTGEIKAVTDTPLDFTRPTPLGARAAQLGANRRYDHNFVLKRKSDSTLRFAARVHDPESGRSMEVWTTEPGLQLYTSPLGELVPNERPGFYCLETQHYPDSVNHPDFPSTILRPGQTFTSVTEFRFGGRP